MGKEGVQAKVQYGLDMKDRSEDLKAEYEGAEEICAGSACIPYEWSIYKKGKT